MANGVLEIIRARDSVIASGTHLEVRVESVLKLQSS